MTKTIWKYALTTDNVSGVVPGKVTRHMPAGARVLSAGVRPDDNGVPCVVVWVEVNPTPNVRFDSHTFYIVPTGGTLIDDLKTHLSFVGTVQNNGIVLHIYEAW